MTAKSLLTWATGKEWKEVVTTACPDDVMMLFNFIFNGNKNNENSY